MKNCDEFVGHFVNGKRNGVGKYYSYSGWTYHGNFVNNQINGFGTKTLKDSSVYKGNFREGLF